MFLDAKMETTQKLLNRKFSNNAYFCNTLFDKVFQTHGNEHTWKNAKIIKTKFYRENVYVKVFFNYFFNFFPFAKSGFDSPWDFS